MKCFTAGFTLLLATALGAGLAPTAARALETPNACCTNGHTGTLSVLQHRNLNSLLGIKVLESQPGVNNLKPQPGTSNSEPQSGYMNPMPAWQDGSLDQAGPFATTVAYMVQFYPLWFTYYQAQIVPPNLMVGPNRVSPIYHIVVAINVDTLYASSLLDLTQEPVILTIPATTANYSILTLDPYGNIFDTGIVAGTPGKYALIGPGWSGTLPTDVTPVAMPLDFSAFIFRADRYNANNEDETEQANEFRKSLKLATLSEYLNDSDAGAAAIKPEIYFSPPFKTVADYLSTHEPIEFLRQLQKAVDSDRTPPLSSYEQMLVNKFNSLFGDGNFDDRSEFAAGARKAHDLIVNRYLTHTGSTNWINFTNIGDWGDNVIDRSSITEFIQYGNGFSTAAYYHAFKDKRGMPLDGSNQRGYVLTFPAGQQPEASRFWSLTAYTPDAIELVPNLAHKYAVARYTPGLQTNSDGSVSIYMSPTLPRGVPEANWLPVPSGPFNVMLRVYGPEGSVADGTYVPPGIVRRGLF